MIPRPEKLGNSPLMSQPLEKDKTMKTKQLTREQIIAILRRAELSAYRNGR